MEDAEERDFGAILERRREILVQSFFFLSKELDWTINFAWAT